MDLYKVAVSLAGDTRTLPRNQCAIVSEQLEARYGNVQQGPLVPTCKNHCSCDLLGQPQARDRCLLQRLSCRLQVEARRGAEVGCRKGSGGGDSSYSPPGGQPRGVAGTTVQPSHPGEIAEVRRDFDRFASHLSLQFVSARQQADSDRLHQKKKREARRAQRQPHD